MSNSVYSEINFHITWHNKTSLPMIHALEWQRGYGIVTFGTKDLQWVIDYINDQKEHHKKGTTNERLEKFSYEEEDG